MASVLVLNGPNLNLLGTRKPEVYGRTTLADVEELCRQTRQALGLDVDFRQSNHEGQLIDWIHEAGPAVRAGELIGAVYNPGAHTHTSVAIRDAIEGVSPVAIECHISNVHAREEFRHHSFISPVAWGSSSASGCWPCTGKDGLHRLGADQSLSAGHPGLRPGRRAAG